jgi:hypothetical protein
MAVNYVKGQILSGILERDGIDIAIANANVGINTTTPTVALDVNGNIQANNFSTTGSPNTGNITGANVISSVTLCAFGNVYGNNVIATGNVSTGNLLTDNLLYANGTPWDLQEPAGSNTQIQFNNNSNFGASANFTFDTAGNLLTVNAMANIANINVAGGANIQGNVTGNYFIGNGSQLSGVTANSVNANSLTGNTLASGVIYSSLQTVGTLANLSVSGNTISGNILTGGVVSAAGNITSGNLTIANTTIVATSANSTVTLQPTGTGLVTINTTTGLVIPVGNTAQRPSPGTTGTIRFNTESTRVEVYDGTEWDTIVGGVTNQILNGDGTTTTFTLDRSTTTAAALIMLNGITQVPGQSYAMTPSPSTNLVFSEAPGSGDVIDIRFL